MPDFEVGQGVYDSSGRQHLPSDRYGLVVGVQDKTVQVVHVLPRRMPTRFWDESEDSRDSFKDNILLHCDGVFSDLRGHAYNNDCYAVADMSHVMSLSKSECRILDGGEKVPQEDLDLVMDHLSRTTPQRDLLQEEQDAARKAPVRRCVPGDRRHSDAVQEPGEGEVALDPFGQRRQRRSMAAQLEEAGRRQARLRAGPEQAPRAEPAADGRTIEERLDTLSRTGVRPPDTGHGGLGS